MDDKLKESIARVKILTGKVEVTTTTSTTENLTTTTTTTILEQ